MGDYPEYLNPFERSSVSRKSITASFREFKHKIRSSFRIKKKTPAAIENNEVQLRKETRPSVPGTLKITNRAPVTSLPPQSTATLNPRSRFEERVRKSSIPDIDQLTLPRRRSCFSNPFEDESPRSSTSTAPRRVYKTRRAPLPPTSTSNQNLSEMSKPDNLSKWSLTSVDTDYSYDRRSDETFDEQNASEVQKEFEQFTNEMSKLTESASREKLNIPDLVVSCPSQRCSEENLTVDKTDEQLTKETVEESRAAEIITEDLQKNSQEFKQNTDISRSSEENLATEIDEQLTKDTDKPEVVKIIAEEDLEKKESNKDVKESSEETLEIAQINPTNENNVVENTTTEELNEATTVNNKENKEITLIPEDATESNLNTEKENNVIENIGEVETDANTATKNEQLHDEIKETSKIIENGAIVVDENANHNGDITENNKTNEEKSATNNNHEENEDDQPFNRKDIKSMIFIDEDEICNEKNKSNDEKPENPPVPKMRKKKLTKKHFLGLLSLKS